MDEKAMRERFGFEIEDASHEIRVLRWKDCGCRPAGAEEIALWDAFAALSRKAEAPGWVSVPVEPDLAMVIAGENSIGRHAWAKMIAAASRATP